MKAATIFIYSFCLFRIIVYLGTYIAINVNFLYAVILTTVYKGKLKWGMGMNDNKML